MKKQGVGGSAFFVGVGGWVCRLVRCGWRGFWLGFRCAGIRNSKCPCGRWWKADASTTDEPSVARPGFVLPSVAAHRCELAGALRFSNSLPKSHQPKAPATRPSQPSNPASHAGVWALPCRPPTGSCRASRADRLRTCMKKNTIQLSFGLL